MAANWALQWHDKTNQVAALFEVKHFALKTEMIEWRKKKEMNSSQLPTLSHGKTWVDLWLRDWASKSPQDPSMSYARDDPQIKGLPKTSGLDPPML